MVEIVQDMHRKISYATFHEGQVLAHAAKGSADEKRFGIGSVQLRIPRLFAERTMNFWARPHRVLQGRLEFPPVGSWVRVCYYGNSASQAEYFGAFFQDEASIHRFFNTPVPNAEAIAFKPVADVIGVGTNQKRIDDVRMNPDKSRILESGEKFVFGVDETNKIIDLRVDNQYELHLSAGNTGKIKIGAVDPKTGNPPAVTPPNKIDMDIDVGDVNGTLIVKLGSQGTAEIKGKNSKVRFKMNELTEKIDIEGATLVTVKSDTKVVVDSPAVELGQPAPGKVLTTVTDPVVDNITGAPHVGSAVVKAAS